MNTILQLIDPNITYALGWTIIHSLWQASLIALVMSIIHRVGEHRDASFKYMVSVVSMVTVFVASMITFVLYYSSASPAEALMTDVELAQLSIVSSEHYSAITSLQSFFAQNLEQINLIWGVGVVLFLARFVFSYAYTKYLKNTAIYTTASQLEQALTRVKESLLIHKTIEIAESAKVNVPIVVGHIKPLILFPLGMINMLSVDEVEAIITHELAHIKRYDYITNMILTLVEILFYFHPAVWWISANIKSERENCCDDFALSHDIDKVTYAKALVKLEELKSMSAPVLAMPFSSKKHQLINRIKRIMNMQQTQNDFKEKSVATILLLSIVFLFSNQANSEIAEHNEFDALQEVMDTTRISGDEEMVLTVKEGKFESLTVDNEKQESELIDHIASLVDKNSTDNQSYTMTVKENPLLEVIDDRVHVKGQGGVIYKSDDSRKFDLSTDTIPKSSSRISTSITQENGKTIEIERENGKITKLKIDGKLIPESEYDNYTEEIESNDFQFDFDGDNRFFHHFDGDDFSKSFGLLFDGEKWREFGGNMEQLFDEDMMDKLRDIENFRFNFKNFEDMKHLQELERLHEMEGLENFEGMEELRERLEEMGIQIDSSLKGLQFHFDDFDGMDGFRFHHNFDGDDVRIFRGHEHDYKSGTVVDKIGRMLNKDGLLKEYKSNKIEITGKHLKINGEKMPKAIFEKYKDIYQQSTGAPLTKNSKMVFDVEGKPSKRKVKTF